MNASIRSAREGVTVWPTVLRTAAFVVGAAVSFALSVDGRAGTSSKVVTIAVGVLSCAWLIEGRSGLVRPWAIVAGVFVYAVAGVATYAIGGLAFLMPSALLAISDVRPSSERRAAPVVRFLVGVAAAAALADSIGVGALIVPCLLPAVVWAFATAKSIVAKSLLAVLAMASGLMTIFFFLSLFVPV